MPQILKLLPSFSPHFMHFRCLFAIRMLDARDRNCAFCGAFCDNMEEEEEESLQNFTSFPFSLSRRRKGDTQIGRTEDF